MKTRLYLLFKFYEGFSSLDPLFLPVIWIFFPLNFIIILLGGPVIILTPFYGSYTFRPWNWQKEKLQEFLGIMNGKVVDSWSWKDGDIE